MLAVPAGRVDVEKGVLHTDDGVTRLTGREADLLRYMVDNPNRTLTYDELLTEVWCYQAPAIQAVYSTTKRLRRKIEVDTKNALCIHGVHGEGYRFTPLRSSGEKELVGRDAELGILREALARGDIIVVSGPRGVGKTALARAAMATEGMGRTVDFCFDRAATPEEALAEVRRVLDDGSDPIGTLQSAIAMGGVQTLLFDNVDSVFNVVVDWAKLLRDAGARVAMTCRRTRGHEPALELKPLEPEAARELLIQRAPHADTQQLGELLTALGGLPMAIELAATGLSVTDAPGLVGFLRRSGQALVDPTPNRPQEPLPAMVAHAWAALTDDECAAMRRLCILPSTFSAALGALVAGEGDCGWDRLAVLREHALLQCNDRGRLYVHDMVRAQPGAPTESDKVAFVSAIAAAHRWSHTGIDALYQLADESLSLLVGLRLALDRSLTEEAIATGRALVSFSNLCGMTPRIYRAIERLVGALGDEVPADIRFRWMARRPNRTDLMAALNTEISRSGQSGCESALEARSICLRREMVHSGGVATAHQLEALAEEASDHLYFEVESDCWVAAARCYMNLGKADHGERCADHAWAVAEAHLDETSRCWSRSLSSVGSVAYQRGDISGAKRMYRRAMDEGQGQAARNFGVNLAAAFLATETAEGAEAALVLCQKVERDLPTVWRAHSVMLPIKATALILLDRFEQARRVLDHLDVACRLGNFRVRAASSVTLRAWIELVDGSPEAALAGADEACASLRSLASEEGMAMAMAIRAQAKAVLGRTAAAIEDFDDARELAEQRWPTTGAMVLRRYIATAGRLGLGRADLDRLQTALDGLAVR